jgi:hypothetical protein
MGGVFCAVRHYAISREPKSRRRRGPISKHIHTQERIKILVMDLEETEARNYCSGEGQQQESESETVAWRRRERRRGHNLWKRCKKMRNRFVR